MTRHFHFATLLLSACALLASCASTPVPPGIAATPWARQSGVPGADRPWAHQTLPGKAPTRFTYERRDGRDVVAVHAEASASLLRQPLRIEPEQLGSVRFSWKVPALIPGADLGARDKADAPVRIVLAFDGDRSRLSARDAALGELVRAVTGEEMPYATLMYVWCNERPSGSVVHNTRTARIRKLVVESGPARLNEWLEYERDIRADFERVFGEPPGALVGVAIMTDTDNTQTTAGAWYGPVRFLPAVARQP